MIGSRSNEVLVALFHHPDELTTSQQYADTLKNQFGKHTTVTPVEISTAGEAEFTTLHLLEYKNGIHECRLPAAFLLEKADTVAVTEKSLDTPMGNYILLHMEPERLVIVGDERPEVDVLGWVA